MEQNGIHNFCFIVLTGELYHLQQGTCYSSTRWLWEWSKRATAFSRSPQPFSSTFSPLKRCQFNKIHVFSQKAHTSFVGKQPRSLLPAASPPQEHAPGLQQRLEQRSQSLGGPSWKPQGFGIPRAKLRLWDLRGSEGTGMVQGCRLPRPFGREGSAAHPTTSCSNPALHQAGTHTCHQCCNSSKCWRRRTHTL